LYIHRSLPFCSRLFAHTRCHLDRCCSPMQWSCEFSSLVEVVRQLGHRLMAVHAQNLSTKITLSSKYQSTRLFASIQSILSVIGSRVLETACTGMTAKNKRLLYRLLLIKTLRTCLFFPALKAAQQGKARTPY
jgi:hypothetical protein